MVHDEQPQAMSQQDMAALIHGQSCPAGYRCLASDCMECLQMYIDRGGENSGG